MSRARSRASAAPVSVLALCIVGVCIGCGEGPSGADVGSADAGSERLDASFDAGASSDAFLAPDAFVAESPLDVIVEVPPTGAYGAHTFVVPARTNWVNSGLHLRAGESAEISATGRWSARGVEVDAGGDASLGMERGCAIGSLVARSGLAYEGAITCIGDGASFVASVDGIVFLGMIESTDLGEAYAERRDVDGQLEVTVQSSGATVPTVRASELGTYALDTVASGWVELLSEHHRVTIEAPQVIADRATAVSSLETLDAIWDQHHALRGAGPFFEQRVRWYPDDTVESFAYMLAGNPIRCVSGLMSGTDDQRILRASEPRTDVWGFAHELGHVFGFIDGMWVYQYLNVESWPNVFTLHALRGLDRTANQPNVETYCDGRDAYLAGGPYETFRNDPFVQLCFLMEFEEQYGATFYERFFMGLNTQTNEDVGYDGTDASVWRYVRDRFDLAAGESTAARFAAWRVPLE